MRTLRRVQDETGGRKRASTGQSPGTGAEERFSMKTCGADFQSRSVSRAWLPGVRNVLLTIGAMFLFGSSMLWAIDTPDTNAPDADVNAQNSQAVRLSSVEGQVRVVQDSQVIADPAYANLPLFEGSQVTTGNDGRAEIQLEDGGVIRLSPNSTLTFPVLQQQGMGSHAEVVLN